MKYLFLFLLSLALVIPHLASPLSFDEFAQDVERMRREQKVPGIAVAVVEGDKVVFLQGFGVCNVDKPEKVNGDTIFQLASTTKAFTAAGLGIQVDKGVLGWDEEVILHLPQFALKDPYPSRYATCRDLLAHRTGLPAFKGDLLGKLGYSASEILFRIRYIEPGSSFREKAQYSNIGFFTAGELLAKLFGSTFEKAIINTLLHPLKMERTGFAEILADANVAAPHANIEGKVQVIPRDDQKMLAPAGGMASSAADMGKWMIMLLNGGAYEGKLVLKAQTIEEMFAPSMVSDVAFTDLPPISETSGFSFGMGWDSYHYNGEMIVEKAGALDGVRTAMTLIPSKKIGIVALANLNLTVLPEMVRAKILEMVLGPDGIDIEKTLAEREKKIAKLFEPEPKPKGALSLGHPLENYTGTFENELYGVFTVTLKDGQLHIDAGPARLEGRLTHWGNNSFLLQWPLINFGHELISFVFSPEGKATQIETETLGIFKQKEKVK